jgi:hypothetical protein
MSDTEKTQVRQDEPKIGTPEYDAAMAAKYRAAKSNEDNPLAAEVGQKPAEAVEKPQRPDNVPEKFWDAEKGAVNTEALLKSYTELEKKGTEKKPEPKKEGEEGKQDEAIKTAVEAAGLNVETLGNKIVTAGDLEDTDYAAFEKIGFSKDVVQEVVEAIKYRREGEQKAALDYAGGETAANDLLNWAAQNLTKSEVEGYNEMLAGPHWRVAIDTLKSRRAGASKTAGEPNLKGGNALGGSPTVGYASREEMKADMQNPLYSDRTAKGEAFRRQVYQKAAVSPWNRK